MSEESSHPTFTSWQDRSWSIYLSSGVAPATHLWFQYGGYSHSSSFIFACNISRKSTNAYLHISQWPGSRHLFVIAASCASLWSQPGSLPLQTSFCTCKQYWKSMGKRARLMEDHEHLMNHEISSWLKSWSWNLWQPQPSEPRRSKNMGNNIQKHVENIMEHGLNMVTPWKFMNSTGFLPMCNSDPPEWGFQPQPK